MENILIGLLVGAASAIPLLVMWRAAERLGEADTVDPSREHSPD